MQFPSKTLALRIATLLTGPTLVMACAQIPRSSVAEAQFPALSCEELAREVAAAQATRAAAEQAKSESWHAVLPFVVAARYADAGAASSEAQRRIGLLSAQAAQRPCAS
ncbi:MAG: hypothetical protein ACK4PH_07185 [Aquincola tertiaricarbonis]|uniref:hypothetical protein n=1 Tax=Aquincola TaxID=391952 RepID=UPI000614A160|nr:MULTISPECIES: hypothetical protein [Aquincola]MCR5868667.1 hypothetical protein [Aquincola sp. J276]